MNKTVKVVLILICVVFSNLYFYDSSVMAQSGRARKSTETEKSDEKPSTPQPQPNIGPIPDGGKIMKQEGDGVNSRFVLKNGVTIIIREAQSLPLASIVTYVKAGPQQEDDNARGVATLTENLLARSSMNNNSGIAALGGTFTAEAGYQGTSFGVTVPSQKADAALANQAEMLLHPNFDGAEFKKAVAATSQELRFQDDNQSEYARSRADAISLHQGEMKTAIDPGESVKSATPEQVNAFFKANYRPGNIVISIAGAVRTSVILQRARQLYGALAGAATAEATAASQQSALKYFYNRGDYSQSVVSISYRVPDMKNAEGPAVAVLATLLGKGRGSWLNRSTLFSKGLITDASADYTGAADAGCLTVRLQIEPDKIDDAEAAYFAEIEKLRRNPISTGEMQRAQVYLEKEFIDSMATVEGQAKVLAYFQSVTGDYKKALSFVTQIRAVGPDDITQAANKYLTVNDASVVEFEAKNAAPRTFPNSEAYAETAKYWIWGARQSPPTKADTRSTLEMPTLSQGDDRQSGTPGVSYDLAPQPVKSFDTLHGPHVLVREDHSQPNVTIGFYFQGGRLTEPASENGITELMLRTMLRGTKDHPNIAFEMEQLGATVDIVNEPDFYGYNLSVLSRNAEAALPLLIELVEHPEFDKTSVAREKTSLLARLKQERDDNRARSMELFWHSIYPNHSYGRDRLGDESVIKAATDDSIKAWYNKTIQRQLPLAILVGDTDGSALVGRYMTEGFVRNELDTSFKAAVPNPTPPFKEVVEPRARKESVEVIGFPGPKGDSADYNGFALLRTLISEQIGQEVLSPTGFAFNQPRFLGGAIAVSLTAAPENESTARSQALSAFQKLASQDISDQQFDMAKSGTISRYNIALQQQRFHALEYGRATIFKHPVEQVDNFGDQIKLIDKSDMKKIAAEYFNASKVAIGAVRADQTSAEKKTSNQ